jgi:hypothetical protein
VFVHDHRTCNGQSLSGTLPNFLGGEERVTDCNWFMIRVRACTIRCRCHNHCRRSRFSQLGTQTWGKPVLQQQAQNQLCILPIRLLFAHSLRPDLSRVSDPQLEPQLAEQPFKPTPGAGVKYAANLI